MSNKNLSVVMTQRIDLKNNWETNNPKLALGELGIEVYDETDADTGVTSRFYRVKIGDAVHHWNDLGYFTYNGHELDQMIVAEGVGASRVKFYSPLYKNSSNVAAALNEVWGYCENVEAAIEKSADECFEIKYSSAHSGLTTLTNAQQAFDYVTDYIDEYTPELKDVIFDPTVTELKDSQGVPITDTQVAFDMLYGITAKNASGLAYENTLSALVATNVQAAIDEIVTTVNGLSASDISYDDSVSQIGTGIDTVQKAVEIIGRYGLNQYLDKFIYDNSVTKIRIDESDPEIHNELPAQGVIEYCINRFNKIVQDLDAAIGVTFDNTNTHIAVGSNIQATTEQLDTALFNLKEKVDALNATQVIYDNTDPDNVVTVAKEISDIDTRVKSIEDNGSSVIKYDNTTSQMQATDVQAAIDEIDSKLDTLNLEASNVTYDDSISQLSTATETVNNVQKAIEVIDGRVDGIDTTLGTYDGDTIKKFTTNTDGDLMWGTIKIGGTDETFHKLASEISYDNTIKTLLSSTQAQGAIDELAEAIDTLDGTKVDYDNTTSGLTATTIGGAIDEVSGTASSNKNRLDNLTASDVAFVATTTLSSTDVQSAIESVDTKIEEVVQDMKAINVSYDDTTSQIGTGIDIVQKAIEGLDTKIDSIVLDADNVNFTVGTTGFTYNNVQAVLEEVDQRLDDLEDNTADDIPYTTQDTSDRPLASTDVRSALDEVNDKVNNIAANKNTAKDVTYDNVDGKITDPTATNMQSALDVLAAKVAGTSGKISNLAKDVVFDPNDTSGQDVPLTSTNAQDAIVEINGKLDNIAANKNTAQDITYSPTATSQFTGATVADVIQEISDTLTNEAGDISYDNSTSGISATTVQGAIDNIIGGLDTHASDIEYENTGTTLTATNAQDAITELTTRTDTIPHALKNVTYDSTKTGWTDVTNGQEVIDKISYCKGVIFDNSISNLKDDTGNPVTNMQDAVDSLNSMYSRFSGQKAEYVTYDGTSSGRTASTNIQNAMDRAFSEIDQAVAKIFDHAEDIKYENDDYPSLTNVKLALDRLLKQVFYVMPEITAFTSNPTYTTAYEIGSTISSVTFNWTINKAVQSQLLTGCSISADDRTATYSTPFSSNKTFKLVVTDKEADSSGNYQTASKEITFAFYPGIYYGSATIPSTYDSTFITGLSDKKLQSSQKGSYSINVASGEYGFIAVPTSYGGFSKVKIGGFDTDVASCGQYSVTNAYGNTQSYYLYRTTNASLGQITMLVE